MTPAIRYTAIMRMLPRFDSCSWDVDHRCLVRLMASELEVRPIPVSASDRLANGAGVVALAPRHVRRLVDGRGNGLVSPVVPWVTPQKGHGATQKLPGQGQNVPPCAQKAPGLSGSSAAHTASEVQ